MVIKPFREHEIFETMSRFLEIEYVYDQEAEPAPTTSPGADLTPVMLDELPPQLLRDLDETTLVLDMDAIREVIERIAEQAPDTAAAVARSGLRGHPHSRAAGRGRREETVRFWG